MNKRINVWMSVLLVLCCAQAVAGQGRVTYSQAFNLPQEIENVEAGHDVKSKIFIKEVTGQELNDGVNLFADGEDAIVQITSLQDERAVRTRGVQRVFDLPEQFLIRKGKVERLSSEESINMEAATQAIQENFSNFKNRARVLRLPAEMGKGIFELKANNKVDSRAKYSLYLYDKQSDLSLNVKSNAKYFKQGEALTFSAKLLRAEKDVVEPIAVDAVLKSPSGRLYPVKGKLVNNEFIAKMPLDIQTTRPKGQLWNLQVSAELESKNTESISRVLSLPMDIHNDTAEIVDVESGDNVLNVSLNVKTEGRYELRVMVYAINGKGESVPAMIEFVADDLVSGWQDMPLAVNKKKLLEYGYRPPFIIHSIELMDQTQIAKLQHWIPKKEITVANH